MPEYNTSNAKEAAALIKSLHSRQYQIWKYRDIKKGRSEEFIKELDELLRVKK